MHVFPHRRRLAPLLSALTAAVLSLLSATGGAVSAQLTPVAPDCTDFEYDQKPTDLGWSVQVRFADEEPGASGITLEEGIVDEGGDLTALTGTGITRVRVWGYTFDFSDLDAGTVHTGPGSQTFCQTDGFTPWNITFRGASADPAVPGDLIATREVAASSFLLSTTGIDFTATPDAPCTSATVGTACFLTGQWTFDFPPVPSEDVRWIGVQQKLGNNAPDGHPCVQMLLLEADPATYDDVAFNRGAVTQDVNEDLQICVGTTEAATLDIDADLTAGDPLTDGILVLRRMFDFSGTNLTGNAVGEDCTRCFSGQIQNYIDALGDALDVDLNGDPDPLTDGIMILRYMFSFRDGNLVAGALAQNCGRCDPDDIEEYIAGLL